MSNTAESFFTALDERGRVPLFRRMSGTLRFDLVSGKRVERWLVTVTQGDVAVSRRNVRADCIVRMDKALFEEMAQGRANAMAAYLRGLISGEGNPELLILFQRLFPGPPGARGRVEPIAGGKPA